MKTSTRPEVLSSRPHNQNSIGCASKMTMSSREVAELVGSRHDNVRVAIERLAERRVIALPAMQEKPTAGRPAIEYVFAGERGKRDSIIVVAQLSPEFTAALVDRWQALEAQEAPRIPETLAEALRLAADQAEQIEKQQACIAIAMPKAEFVDRYVDGTGLKGFRQVAKLLHAKENDFRAFLQDKRVIYRLRGEWVPFAEHIDAGRVSVKTGQANNGYAFNATMFTPKGVQWIAGLWAAHQMEVAP
ncbi:phage antirepressor KilAC domain-containing protein [Stutzerimonas stutzeri]|uniref:phage antirepressor KilAC domain-containing protein n=1 Tax=Stutzerimonas stutzeri TaxID=316 RepID=UPI000F7A5BB1|nr:phage antirepressor KilAC domain-containing protein [Stutzerimonas stutzeri]MBS9726119.1 phage antirepressor KilAC domain-containing protein [Stutzerimonas stutzeri]MCP3433206.1 phage antirepressor KilAC domain-containing protein [Stutzerimonas stutzeri]RRV58052.1 phage regulatory protein/antirepressor Ant [Stutzerimonas stutzeri]RTM25190.1 phage regulatory protein/antirepressor Ant [Stutzerimonas stutzeri]